MIAESPSNLDAYNPEENIESGSDEGSEDGNGEFETANAREDGHNSHGKNSKPPTAREIREIKDASDLYASRSFKLQVDELLPNVRPPATLKAALDRFLLALHTAISSVKPTKTPLHPLAASRELLEKGVAVPYPHPLPTEDTNWKVAYTPPEEITLVGSWATATSIKKPGGLPWTADVAVEMPASLFQEKDYVNARFLHKRAFYLAHLAAGLSSKKSQKALGTPVELHYESVDGDTRRTTLLVRLKKEGVASEYEKLVGAAQVRILPMISPSNSPMPFHRMSPSQSNIRASSSSTSHPSLSKTADSTSAPSSSSTNPPTPIYNAALLRSYTPRAHLLSSHALASSIPAYADALALLRVWALQRGYGESGSGSGAPRWCVAGFEGLGGWWSALLGVLVEGEEEVVDENAKGKKRKEKNTVGRGLSSYQLFRAALDLLSKHDFVREPVLSKTGNGHRFSPAEYSSDQRPTFVDTASLLNMLVDVPPSSLESLRRDARATLEALDHSASSVDPFKETFLKDQRDLITRFDVVLRVDLSSAKLRTNTLQNVLEHGAAVRALHAAIPPLLTRALGDRIKSFALLYPTSSPRPLSQAHPAPHPSTQNTVYIGLQLNTTEAFRLIDHGPAADDPDKSIAEAFRAFWGPKAELRRFKDGRIVESVVWEAANADERARVPERIARFVLERHCGVSASSISAATAAQAEGTEPIIAWQVEFDKVLRAPPAVATMRTPTVEGSAPGFRGAQLAFDVLVKALRSIEEELNLAILSVTPISPYLRHTSPLAPLPLSSAALLALGPRLPINARYLPCIDLVLQFEKSAKWPDDFRAVQKIKLAFFERLANLLLALPDKARYRAEIRVDDPCLEASTFGLQAESRLEVLSPDGWAFGLRIWHEREAEMLDKISGVKKLPKHLALDVKPGEQKAALVARETYNRRFVHAPKHHRAIADLHHRFPAYSGTVRLAKRWLASHWLLDTHVSEEVVEILVAAVFLRNRKTRAKEPGTEGTDVPCSKERGFALVVELLKDWDWSTGLFVPLYGGDGETEMEKPELKAGSGKGIWRISTEEDKVGSVWTRHSPQLVAAERVRAIARATWNALKSVDSGSLSVEALFTHPDQGYDFVIHLDPSVLPRYFQNVASNSYSSSLTKYANLSSEGSEEKLRVGWDPAQLFFDDLKNTYADTFVLFFDVLGGNRIGGIWVPGLAEKRPFKVLAGYSSQPVIPNTQKTKTKTKNDEVILNQQAVLREVERLGTGLVTSIKTKS